MSDTTTRSRLPENAAISNSANLNLFAAFLTTHNPDQSRASFARHIAWATEQEEAGRLFLAGPLTPQDGENEATGLTIFRVGSLAEAEALAQADPFVAEGGMTVQVRPWMVVGGSLSLSLRLSNSSIAIG